MFGKIRHNQILIYTVAGLSALLATLAVLLPGARLLIAFFAYTATLNSGLIPFPTMTVAIFLGKSYSPLLVAAVGAAGSAIASVIIYYLLTGLSKRKRMRRIKDNRLARSLRALTRRSPFLSLALFNLIPLPIEPARFSAILNRYSIARYVTAISLGRFARYFLLATLGEAFRVPNSVLLVLTAALIAVPLVVKRHYKEGIGKSEEGEGNREENIESFCVFPVISVPPW
jgi:uncharacterized membrane protein YdjX (TVP38/TMEM64 family)